MNAEDIVKAVTDAGFQSVEEFTEALKLARLVLQRNALSYAVEAKRAAQKAASQATESEVQGLQSQISAIDTALATFAAQ